jgi:glycosyltransferase involved in cell wall biosynthesis
VTGSEAQGISVVVPVLDDLTGVRELLESLSEQTRLPDECVVVDGGSTDGTREFLLQWRGPFPLRLLSRHGRNIAASRNEGVAVARFDWIASTDAGCRPMPGWLAAIDAERDQADFVAGVVQVEGTSALERLLAITHYPRAAELQEPPAWMKISHRLFGRGFVGGRVGGGYMAFRKSTWRAVGGFPEHVYAGEDRAFASRVEEAGLRSVRSPDAIVRWCPPSTWAGNARMFYTYSRGDVRSGGGRDRHVYRFLAWLLAARVALSGSARARGALVLGSLAYMGLPVERASRTRIPSRDWWRIPAVIALKDLAQIAGALHGAFDAFRGRPQPPPRRRGSRSWSSRR